MNNTVQNNTTIPAFSKHLKDAGVFEFRTLDLDTMQINLGYMCNQTCSHCHVEAGPTRKEIMTRQVMQACLEAIDASDIRSVDLTGGAPEMNPEFVWFVEQLSVRGLEIIVRSNLTILVTSERFRALPKFFKKHKVTIIASLPCYTSDNVEKQRGKGVFGASIEALQNLNALGYGKKETNLKLHLVFNPGGPSLPPDQVALESDYKIRLQHDFSIIFNQLFTITNLPIKRYKEYLKKIGKEAQYMELLHTSFNLSTLDHLMCRKMISIDWQGEIFDCDFNQMLNLKTLIGINIFEFNKDILIGREIAVADHCYGCTAGAGSSCGGALT